MAEVVDGHLRAGRRYVRLQLREISRIDRAALTQLQRANDAFLDAHGRLLLTGVGPVVRTALADAGVG